MEKDKGRERVRDGGHGVLVYYFSFFFFFRVARDAFFFTYTVC